MTEAWQCYAVRAEQLCFIRCSTMTPLVMWAEGQEEQVQQTSCSMRPTECNMQPGMAPLVMWAEGQEEQVQQTACSMQPTACNRQPAMAPLVMWAEGQKKTEKGRTSRPRIVQPARPRWATPDVLDGIGMWHDGIHQTCAPRQGGQSVDSQTESGLSAKHAAALAGRIRPVDVGSGSLSCSESAASPEPAATVVSDACVLGIWGEQREPQQHWPTPGVDLMQWRRSGWSGEGPASSQLQV